LKTWTFARNSRTSISCLLSMAANRKQDTPHSCDARGGRRRELPQKRGDRSARDHDTIGGNRRAGCACLHAAVHKATWALTYRRDDPARGAFDPVRTGRNRAHHRVPIQPRQR
jgi:hypothetical protein